MSACPAPLRDALPLAGRRILIVEDEYFLADDIDRTLRALGAEIAGPVGEIDDALDILNEGSVLDGAVLDVNIRDQMIFPVANELRLRHVPFVFTSGYHRIVVGTSFETVPLWEKPIDLSAMACGLTGMILKP